SLIPLSKRRHIWHQLRQAGYDLPGLALSDGLLAALLIVLGPLAFLGILLKGWLMLLSLPELGMLVYKLTRPFAIHARIGCETVHEAVLQLTPFERTDYLAGLWSSEDIAAKVRLEIAEALNVPFASITNETRLCDLMID